MLDNIIVYFAYKERVLGYFFVAVNEAVFNVFCSFFCLIIIGLLLSLDTKTI